MKLLKKLLLIFISLAVVVLVIYLFMEYRQEEKQMDETARKLAPGQFITLSDGITHYLELGPRDGIPLLFIHGGGITGMEVWNENAAFFAEEGYRVLLYDLYGRGYSDRVNTTYTPTLLNRQLTELIEAIHFPDTFHIISMSLGGKVALEYAAQHPQAFASLTLIDPAITGDYRPNRLLKIPVLSSLLMTLYWYPRAVENQRKEFVNQPLFEEYAQRLRYFMGFKGYKRVNYSSWMHTLNQDNSNLLEHLPANKVMLIYGDRDPYFATAVAEKLHQLYPTLTQHVIAETGHMPHFEKPNEVNPLLLDFLRR